MRNRNQYLLFFACLFLGFLHKNGHAQNDFSKQQEDKIGEAYIGEGAEEIKIILNASGNIWNSEDVDEIYFKHNQLDSLTIEKNSSGNYKAYYPLKSEFFITVSEIKLEDKNIEAFFTIDLPNFSDGQAQAVKIHLINKSEELSIESSDERDKLIVGKYILPVVHDFLAVLTSKMSSGESCIEKAVKACGKNKIKYVDVGLFAKECSFECE